MNKAVTTLVSLCAFGLAQASFAATYTNYTDSTTAPSLSEKGMTYTRMATVSFATASAANDTYKVIPVGAEQIVLSTEYEVLTTNTGNAVTFALGTSFNSNGLVASAGGALTAVGHTVSSSNNALFKTAGTIDLISEVAITGGSVRVRALIWDVSR